VIVTPTLPSTTLGELGAAGAMAGVVTALTATNSRLNPLVSKNSVMTCSPAVSVTGTFTVVQVCQPPVAGTGTAVRTLLPLNPRRSDAPPFGDATRS
jgi:hypothetical protein